MLPRFVDVAEELFHGRASIARTSAGRQGAVCSEQPELTAALRPPDQIRLPERPQVGQGEVFLVGQSLIEVPYMAPKDEFPIYRGLIFCLVENGNRTGKGVRETGVSLRKEAARASEDL